ncbi:MAG: 4-hydroxy-tetrahydrodipicolinate synthase [Pseudomonadota bacterium]
MITGSIVALVTPMHDNGSVDWEALGRLIELHIEAGTAAIGAVGTTGESATLSVPEHCEVIRYCVERCDGRIPVIAGTGANATEEAVDLTATAADVGAEACLLVTPYYNRPPQRGLYQHYARIAEQVQIPQILYNVPGRTAVDMDNDTVVALAELDNIVGIKDATGDLARCADLVARCPEGFAIYSGDDPTAMELMLGGGHGSISVTANVAPALAARLCNHALAGDRAAAEAINQQLDPLNRALFLEANPIPVKWALHDQGLIAAGIRLPLVSLDKVHHEAVRAALTAAQQ